MNRITRPLLAAALLAALVWSGCGEALMDAAHAPDNLAGRVTLENQAEHSNVEVTLTLGGWSVTLLTDAGGTFTVPSDLAAGEWTMQADFPFFGRASGGFTVENGLPTSDLADLLLPRRVRFDVTTDAPAYRLGDPVEITLVAGNTGDETIVLKSATSPMFAVAVVADGRTHIGSLMPGSNPTPEEVTLAPGEQRTFQVTWRTEATPLAPGFYNVYAILAASETYPDFFSADFPELNDALFAKLVPAPIELVAFVPTDGNR
jgi:hypothetical protein